MISVELFLAFIPSLIPASATSTPAPRRLTLFFLKSLYFFLIPECIKIREKHAKRKTLSCNPSCYFCCLIFRDIHVLLSSCFLAVFFPLFRFLFCFQFESKSLYFYDMLYTTCWAPPSDLLTLVISCFALKKKKRYKNKLYEKKVTSEYLTREAFCQNSKNFQASVASVYFSFLFFFMLGFQNLGWSAIDIGKCSRLV